MLLIDDETGSYWDHITGEGLHGPLKGAQLATFPLRHTTVAAALAEFPGLRVFRVRQGLLGRAVGSVVGKALGSRGLIPPFFRGTMGEPDTRLDELDNGLGVIVEGRARFYPMSRLDQAVEEDWAGRRIRVALGEIDGAPHATWVEDGQRPMQLLSRWYGFSYSFPGCSIYGDGQSAT